MLLYLVELPFYILVKEGFAYSSEVDGIKFSVTVQNDRTKFVHIDENGRCVTRYVNEDESVDHQTQELMKKVVIEDQPFYRLYIAKSVLNIILEVPQRGEKQYTIYFEENNTRLKRIVSDLLRYYYATLSEYDISPGYYSLIPKSYYNANNTATYEKDEQDHWVQIANHQFERGFYFPDHEISEEDQRELQKKLEKRARLDNTLSNRARVKNALQFGDITSAIIHIIAYIEKISKEALAKTKDLKIQHVDSMFHDHGLDVFLDEQAPQILPKESLTYVTDVKALNQRRTSAVHWLASIEEQQKVIAMCENALKFGDSLYEFVHGNPVVTKKLKSLPVGISLDAGKAGEESRFVLLTSKKMAKMAEGSRSPLNKLVPKRMAILNIDPSTRISTPSQDENVMQAYLQNDTLFVFLSLPVVSIVEMVEEFARNVAGRNVIPAELTFTRIEFSLYCNGAIPKGVIQGFKEALSKIWQDKAPKIVSFLAYNRDQLDKINTLFEEKRKQAKPDLIQREKEWSFYFIRVLKPVGNGLYVLSPDLRDQIKEIVTPEKDPVKD